MSKTFDEISSALDELITDYKENDGKNLNQRTVTISITQPKKFDGHEIRNIRIKNRLTQVALSKYLG